MDRWQGKGFDTLIKIWGKIASLYPDWTLDILGGGKDANFNYLQGLAYENNVSNRVQFLGRKENVAEILKNSSVFVLSSRYEGLPMALIEAMSQGCACISFDCPSGPKEIITNNKSGLLVRDQDINGMKEALISVIENENLRESLSLAAKKEVQKFDPDTIVNEWEKLFLS
ncbi:glycosyltransferase [Niabella ginsengisoli]|uniref:Glycosyltransferase n=1 Tax=Niabella ginsengisoli TaxID=522298 RepID=A0ABS9SK46_9BACT|nr:glycosyltransferase [Niabella ginsengisoli]